jgi:glycosyltransferase involved in cell wall biosynthesis
MEPSDSPSREQKRLALFLPSLAGGGAERIAANILSMFPNVDRHLVLMENAIAYDFDAKLHVLAGEFLGKGLFADRAARVVKNLVALRRMKAKLGPATWLSFTTWANILNVLTAQGERVVISSHSIESVNIQGRFGAVLRAMVRYAYPKADAIVAVSDSVGRDLVEQFGVPERLIQTIHNALDLASTDALAAQQPPEHLARVLQHPTVVTAGRLAEPKGQWHLVRVFARLKSQVPAARLIVLGGGPLGAYLVDLARGSGLSVWAAWEGAPEENAASADVVFAGFCQNPFSVFARASVFAFPSLWEGFGNVILEALACRVLVLAADSGSGPREILAPEAPLAQPGQTMELASAGVLLPRLDGVKRAASDRLAKDEEAWLAAVARALRDPSLRDRYLEAGRARALAFSSSALAPAWERVLMGPSTPPAR